MSKVVVTESYLSDIAEAIRSKNGSSSTYRPGQMAAAIAAIPTGGDVDIEALNVTVNGTYTAPTGKAYSPVIVNVPAGGGAGMYGFSLTGGYNGGAALLLVVDGETVLSATGNSPYNDTFVPSSGSFSINGITWSITINTRSQGVYVDVVISDGEQTISMTVTANGPNGSYGYNYSRWGFLNG